VTAAAAPRRHERSEAAGPGSAPAVRSLVLAPFFDLAFVNNRPRTVAEVLGHLRAGGRGHHRLRSCAEGAQARRCVAGRPPARLPADPAYRRNVSPQRFWSHVAFARRALALVRARRGEYDVVYATVPFNLLAAGAFAAMPDALRVLDVVDIWPDVLPFPGVGATRGMAGVRGLEASVRRRMPPRRHPARGVRHLPRRGAAALPR
jgi:hypothetical protein